MATTTNTRQPRHTDPQQATLLPHRHVNTGQGVGFTICLFTTRLRVQSRNHDEELEEQPVLHTSPNTRIDRSRPPGDFLLTVFFSY